MAKGNWMVFDRKGGEEKIPVKKELASRPPENIDDYTFRGRRNQRPAPPPPAPVLVEEGTIRNTNIILARGDFLHHSARAFLFFRADDQEIRWYGVTGHLLKDYHNILKSFRTTCRNAKTPCNFGDALFTSRANTPQHIWGEGSYSFFGRPSLFREALAYSIENALRIARQEGFASIVIPFPNMQPSTFSPKVTEIGSVLLERIRSHTLQNYTLSTVTIVVDENPNDPDHSTYKALVDCFKEDPIFKPKPRQKPCHGGAPSKGRSGHQGGRCWHHGEFSRPSL